MLVLFSNTVVVLNVKNFNGLQIHNILLSLDTVRSNIMLLLYHFSYIFYSLFAFSQLRIKDKNMQISRLPLQLLPVSVFACI